MAYDGERFPSGSLEFPIDDTEGKVLLTCAGISFRNSFNGKIRNMNWQAGKLMDAVFIRDGKIVQFQYPEPTTPIVEPEEHFERITRKFGE